jgi:large exoprotein involved in heme utilization and adhesion
MVKLLVYGCSKVKLWHLWEGDVALEGGYLTAPDGRIELGSVAGNSLVSLTPTLTGYTPSYGGVTDFQDIRLTQGASVTTSGNSGGSILVQGANVTLTDGSRIEVNTLGTGDRGGFDCQRLRIGATHWSFS